MATGWVKSLQCRSNAVDDVYHPKPPPPVNDHQQQQQKQQPWWHKKNRKPGPPLLPLGCGANTSQALRDVVALFPKHPLPRTAIPKKPPPVTTPALFATPSPSPPLKEKPPKQSKPKPCHQDKPTRQSRRDHHHHQKGSRPKSREPTPSLPTMTELPAGHSSRRVVEIIFCSSWSGTGAAAPFPGVIEVLFKVRNPPRTVARFEEYREAVRSRAGPGDARCAADGNEMMRFHSAADVSAAAAAADPVYDAGVMCSPAAPGGGIRTFAGSGGAHESAAWAGRRRAMLVCRVIAGRVRTGSDAGEFESVSVGEGELLVFDQRAVLPCFLIIYKA